MKKKEIIIIAVLLVVFVGLRIFVTVADSPAKMSDKNVTQVTAPDQKEAQENEQFTVAPVTETKIEGTNVALDAPASANGYTDVYTPVYATDGSRDTTSYWEGEGTGDDQLEVDLKKSYTIHTIRIGLNPATIWGKRTQTMKFSVSEDGKNYTDIVPTADYDFDPKKGNEVVIPFDAVKARYVKVTITNNTGAKGGQVAEFEIYSNDK